jgi:hypothetical protein
MEGLAVLFHPSIESIWFIGPKEPTIGSENLTDRGIHPLSSLWQRYLWYSIGSIDVSATAE